jgi:uroporphyrin-III C-methyltransferase/precorrin-2 dehydrogenase/sirohydrochlorin ferrochelatase
VAARKAEKLREAGARLQVIASRFDPSRNWWAERAERLWEQPYDGLQSVERPFLVIAATNDATVNAKVTRDARALGALVLNVSEPSDSDIIFPATLRRGSLTVSFATDGRAPALARYLRQDAESRYGEHLNDVISNVERFGKDETIGVEVASVSIRGASKRNNGRVTLVGAGPGDPELLTLKAMARLRAADVVVHDDLVSIDVMDRHALGARRINVGKRKGVALLRQEAINDLLIALAKEGLNVVRLKGGDPCVFGRAEEELHALQCAGIDCEIVPGVSNLSAVPAAAGIVVTNRDNARSLGAFSLHKRDGKKPSYEEWEQMAKGPDTLVLFMGRTILREACARLIEHGRTANTPAALIVNGTLPNQQVVRGTLCTLADASAKLDVEGPGLIVVGEAVGRG